MRAERFTGLVRSAILPKVHRTVARTLEERRKELQLTQIDVAHRAATTQAQYSKWETGKANPKPLNLLRLAIALECNVDYLLAGLNAEYDRRHGNPRAKAPPDARTVRHRRASS